MNMIIGYILIVLGVFGMVGSFTTISNDWRYTYKPPYTDHETTMIALLIISVVVFIVGIMVIIFSVVKKKNEDKLKEITNIPQMNSNGQLSVKNKCPNCGLNVSDTCTICPRCGQKINGGE